MCLTPRSEAGHGFGIGDTSRSRLLNLDVRPLLAEKRSQQLQYCSNLKVLAAGESPNLAGPNWQS